MKKDNLIITPSGIRGVIGKGLTIPTTVKFGLAFGQWIQKIGDKIIVGRDTRTSSEIFESAIIAALVSVGCKIINLGICPAPVIIHAKNKLKIPGGVIISGSHNPQEWNGLKFISQNTFLSNKELEEIINVSESGDIKAVSWNKLSKVKVINPIDDYIKDLFNNIDINSMKEQNNLKVVVDTGAGAANMLVPKLLKSLGCEVKVINNEFVNGYEFPRNPEPIESNLESLMKIIKDEHYDIGFAYDCDADRLSIVDENGKWHQEDIGLALITEQIFSELSKENKKGIFVTNIASSLMFDAIVNKYDGLIARTPIGERYLAEKMLLIKEKREELDIATETFIFGGEGSCGGVMFPAFNNTRDAIFATAKIIEILVKSDETVSNLINKLPKFYSKRVNISIHGKDLGKIKLELKNNKISQGKVFSEIGQDIKILYPGQWFVLIHLSNTEPVIRIISEAKSEDLAEKLVQFITQIVQKFSEN